MTEAQADPASQSPGRATTAGGLIRHARQAQGLHIAALAAAIKVVPRKLELLESDQFDQLPDATFTRALAQTVCRSLKIDAAPVLALLPPSRVQRLEHVASGLNTPFNERPGRLASLEGARVAGPVLWIAALLVLAAVAVYVVPDGWLRLSDPASPTATDAAPGSDTGLSTATPAGPAQNTSADAPVETSPPFVAPVVPEPATATSAALPVLTLRATAPSWVEVVDARGQPLIARVLSSGESFDVDGQAPFKLKVGNAQATQVVYRGEPVSLARFTRDNVARFELK
jgi:cytoskeleton protein RodZ